MDPPPPNDQAYHSYIPYRRNPYYPSQPQPPYAPPQYYHNYHFPYPPSFPYSIPPPPIYYHEQAYVTQHFQPPRYPAHEMPSYYPPTHFDEPNYPNSEDFPSSDPTTRSTRVCAGVGALWNKSTPSHTRGDDVDRANTCTYSSTSIEPPLSPESNQTTLEQRLNDFIRETREENAKLKETITKEMLGEIQELRHETLSPLQTVESTLAKIMEMIQSQGETDVNAVTLRSGRTLPEVVPPPPQSIPTEEPRLNNEETSNSKQVERTPEEELSREEMQPQPSRKGKEIMEKPPPVPKAKLPFPQRFRTDIDNAKYDKFLQMLRQLHIDMSFIDALGEMPRYAKFLKDLLSNKKRLAKIATVVLGEECSAILHKDVPKKLKDPGSFTIPCNIGGTTFNRALADLGASINLMPFALYRKLNLGTLKPTRMCIQLADRSTKYPRGIVEDVLVRVDKFIFPVDFVILDMDLDVEIPLILGRPFLAIARALIDVGENKLVIRVGDESASFDVTKIMKYPLDGDGYFFVDYVHDEIDYLCEVPKAKRHDFNRECPIGAKNCNERKELLVVIATDLSEKQKEQLLTVLKRNKEAIGWKMTGLKGINPAICTHKIVLEEGSKPVAQPQRRLNPNTFEVLKNKVIKLMDVRMIYPISDSTWVSPTHVVPKTGGITVTENDNKELIPTRKITGWRVCIDYSKLNEATRKDHFPLPFIDQMIEKISLVILWNFSWTISQFLEKLSKNALEIWKRRFIKDFSKIARPLTKLLEKDATFELNEDAMKAFQNLKDAMVHTPILVGPKWDQQFELMCDASNFAVGVVLGQKNDKKFQPIAYARSSFILIMRLSDFLCLNPKQSQVIRSILLLQEFDVTIVDRKGVENSAADHLSRLENEKGQDMIGDVNEYFPEEKLMGLYLTPWYADLANYLVGGELPEFLDTHA
ncbi:uncharacterized protein LOC116033234 [Ipomoea triloba]|uniref:uncharacterized protein LOC116033234 n=1 Tax=Ipomoea triloba TaxID=35885 RepID=UPI00125DE734|nr:uncharacterized protein LOC116033234 [Ipomoea triloba]